MCIRTCKKCNAFNLSTITRFISMQRFVHCMRLTQSAKYMCENVETLCNDACMCLHSVPFKMSVKTTFATSAQ